MVTYKSKPQKVNKSAEELSAIFADLSQMQGAIDALPEEARNQAGNVVFTTDSIKMDTNQVGEIAFTVIERTPSKVVFGTQSSPVPMTMDVNITPLSTGESEVVTAINVDIPAMLRPLVGPHIQKATDKFGELIAKLSE